MSKKLRPVRFLANRYGRSDRTIARWVEVGLLPKPIYIRGLRYWNEEELDQLDNARKSEAA
jgi:hypothetical protein